MVNDVYEKTKRRPSILTDKVIIVETRLSTKKNHIYVYRRCVCKCVPVCVRIKERTNDEKSLFKIYIYCLYISKVHVVCMQTLGMILNRINIKAMRPHAHMHTQTFSDILNHTLIHTLAPQHTQYTPYLTHRTSNEQHACMLTYRWNRLTVIADNNKDP